MHSFFAITLTLLAAIILTLLPMPDWTIWLRPVWVLMVLIYWAMMTPYLVGVGVAWITGLIMDLLNDTLLGEHALAFTIVIYLVGRMHIRLRMYPMLQQGFSIGMFVLIYLFILYCIQGFIGQLPGSHLYWLAAVTSMLLWPWLFVVMRDCRSRFKVG
jgi:rod shape-determining protein MreD